MDPLYPNGAHPTDSYPTPLNFTRCLDEIWWNFTKLILISWCTGEFKLPKCTNYTESLVIWNWIFKHHPLWSMVPLIISLSLPTHRDFGPHLYNPTHYPRSMSPTPEICRERVGLGTTYTRSANLSGSSVLLVVRSLLCVVSTTHTNSVQPSPTWTCRHMLRTRKLWFPLSPSRLGHRRRTLWWT